WASYSAISAAPSSARILAISSRSSTGLRAGSRGQGAASVNSVTRRSAGGLRGGYACFRRILIPTPTSTASKKEARVPTRKYSANSRSSSCLKRASDLAAMIHPAAAASVHLAGPERGGQRIGEQRNDEQRVHAGSLSRSARNILSPAATRGQAMRRARWEIALRSTSSRTAAAAGSPSRSRVAVRRWRAVQLQYSAE